MVRISSAVVVSHGTQEGHTVQVQVVTAIASDFVVVEGDEN